MIEVDVQFRQHSGQTALDGSIGATPVALVGRTQSGSLSKVQGEVGGATVTVQVITRRMGTGIATMSGVLGDHTLDLAVVRHMQTGLDINGTIDADTVALRLDRPVGNRRRVIHRQPQPDVSLQVSWQKPAGTVTGSVTRPVDAVVAALVGLVGSTW